MKFHDQMQRSIDFADWPPKRIVSLVPSQTELLHDLGLGDRVVGITKFCVHPNEWFMGKARIGGTKTVNFEKIAALKPDLIIGNKEENEKTQIEELSKHYPVWVSDVLGLESALEMIVLIGEMTGTSKKAAEIGGVIAGNFNSLAQLKSNPNPISCAYLIWRKPYMVAARGTFVDAMLQKVGFANVFSDKTRYPAVTMEDLQASNPALILLSSEPFPFKEKHIKELQALCPNANIQLVDGELFSWYGSRLRFAPAYFESLRKNF